MNASTTTFIDDDDARSSTRGPGDAAVSDRADDQMQAPPPALEPTWPSPAVSTSAGAENGDGPGQRLRRAREARRMEPGRVAQELRLRPTVVDALERDDYASLPGAVYIGGYLRGYARLLGLDPEPLLAAFRERHPDAEAPPPRATPRSASRDEMEGRGGGVLVPLVSALVVFALLGGVYLWWQNGSPMPTAMSPFGPPGAPASLTESRPLAGAGADRETVPARQGADVGLPPGPDASPDSRLEPGAVRSPGTDAELTMAPEPGLELDADITAGIIGAVSAVGTDTGSDRRPDDASVPPASGAADSPGSASPATASPASGSPTGATSPAASAGAQTGQPNEVVLAFSGPSWVDVRDANGESQLFGELASGDRRVLGGEPPYSLIIGNASAVTLTIGEAPFDLNAIARGNVARFKLDPATVAGRDDTTSATADGAN